LQRLSSTHGGHEAEKNPGSRAHLCRPSLPRVGAGRSHLDDRGIGQARPFVADRTFLSYETRLPRRQGRPITEQRARRRLGTAQLAVVSMYRIGHLRLSSGGGQQTTASAGMGQHATPSSGLWTHRRRPWHARGFWNGAALLQRGRCPTRAAVAPNIASKVQLR
jgi:hypothetical protein